VIAPPKLKVDLKEKTLQEFKGDDEQLSQKLKKYIREKSVQLSSLQKEYSELNRLQKEYEISQSILDEKRLQLQTIENKLSQLQLLSDEEMEQNNEELTKYTDLLFANGLQRKLEFCKEEFDKMLILEEERKQKEIQTLQVDIDKLTPYILVDESEIALLAKLSQAVQEIAVIVRDVKLSCETAEELIEIEEILSDNIESTKEKLKELHSWDREEDYNKLKRDIQTIQHNILQLNELITKGTTSGYHCPQCNVPFYIDTKSSQIKTLRSDPKVLRIELQQLKDDKTQKENALDALEQERTLFYKREETIRTKSIKLQSIYNSFLKVYKPIQDDLQTVEEPFQDLFERLKQHRQNLTQYKTLEIKLQQVKNIKINSQKAVLQKQQQITQLQNELTHYIIPDEDWHEEYIQVQIDNCKERITIHKQTEKVYTQLEKEKVSIQKEIDKISHLVSQQDNIQEVEQSIQDLESSLKLKQNNVDKLELRLKKLYKYEQELSEYEEQQNLLQQIKDCKSEERLILRGISKAELLSRRVGDAESLSLQQTIDRINGDIEEYITAFFDDTCSAHLSAFKETKDKDKKSLIDIEFSRNGEMVSIDSLSGGEYDRLALALFLSFGSQSPVMMLDECLASLHSELVEEIIEKIQEKMSHKLVLFTLHQANTGIFDHIIDVEKLAGGCCRQL
jgi:DNA repair exonuclease SbcCD ATPase subunit